MIHVDLDYALSVAGAVVAAIMGCLFFFGSGIEAERADVTKCPAMAGTLGAVLILVALVCIFHAGQRSGSIYHPCVVESFETMKMKCR